MTDPASSIGANIRRRRQALGLTLEGLAKESGVSATMLSEVERAVKNPTVKLAYQIASALGCSLTDLIEGRTSVPVTVIRADERRTLVDPATHVVRHGLTTELLNRDLELAWYTLPPAATTGAFGANRPGVVEFVTVLTGEATIVLGGEPYSMRAGDSLTYGPQTTTEYRNDGPTETRILVAVDSSRA